MLDPKMDLLISQKPCISGWFHLPLIWIDLLLIQHHTWINLSIMLCVIPNIRFWALAMRSYGKTNEITIGFTVITSVQETSQKQKPTFSNLVRISTNSSNWQNKRSLPLQRRERVVSRYTDRARGPDFFKIIFVQGNY